MKRRATRAREKWKERRWFRQKALLSLGLLLVLAVGCGGSGTEESGSDGVWVVATISVVQDLVEQVGGDRVEVSTIVPVGGSPETFQPKPSDAGTISEAQVVFENGLGLEAWLDDLLESAGEDGQIVVELSHGLEPLDAGEHEEEEHADEHGHAEGNPHFWLDVANAEHYVKEIRDTLAEVDPEGAKEYRENAREYLERLEKLDGYVEERTATIPEDRRKLVTFHDAFPYFAEAYGFEMVGVVLQNPDAEPSSREVAEVVSTIEEERVPAVFTEPQFSSGLADTIAQEADVEVYELYTDTLVEDEAGNTYEAMMRTNTDRIVGALR